MAQSPESQFLYPPSLTDIEGRRLSKCPTLIQLAFDSSSANRHTDRMIANKSYAEEAFLDFVSQSPLRMVMLDRNLEVMTASPGWKKQQLSGAKTELALFERIALKEMLKKALAGQAQYLTTDEFRNNQNKSILFKWAAHPWLAKDGSIGGMIVTNEEVADHDYDPDLTKLLVNLAESAAEGMAIIRADDQACLYVNRAMERMLGYEVGELIETPLFTTLALDTPSKQKRFEEAKSALLQRGFWHGELLNKTKSGKTIWTYNICTAQNHCTHGNVWIIHKIDISEMKNARLSALRERQRFDSLIEGIERSANLVFTNTNGIITYANDRFCKLTGFSRDELIGKSHRIMNSGAHASTFFKFLWETILSGDVWTGEICNKRRDGSLFWMETTIIPLFDSNGNIEQFLAVRFDVSERKTIEQKLTNSAKLASLGEMAGGIAHEINNPLTVIAGSALSIEDLLKSDPTDKLAIRARTVKIMQYVDRISRIIRGMKSFTRSSDHDKMNAYSARSIIEDTLDMCTDKFNNRGIPITTEGALDVELRCRPTEIAQILVNLLNNSYDSVSGSTSPWVKIEVARRAEQLEIRVTDSGRGIPPEIARQIFQPFFTTKAAGKGTGLGLSISKGIAEQHGGKFYLDLNHPNTSFVLTLPIAT